MTNPIGPVGGPGSLTVPIRVNLADLRGRLGEANHPLAAVPQWNGGRFYLVQVWHNEIDDTEPPHSVLLVTANSLERAEEVALSSVRTRERPDWLVRGEEIQLNAGRQLQHTLRLRPLV